MGLSFAFGCPVLGSVNSNSAVGVHLRLNVRTVSIGRLCGEVFVGLAMLEGWDLCSGWIMSSNSGVPHPSRGVINRYCQVPDIVPSGFCLGSLSVYSEWRVLAISCHSRNARSAASPMGKKSKNANQGDRLLKGNVM